MVIVVVVMMVSCAGEIADAMAGDSLMDIRGNEEGFEVVEAYMGPC